MRLLTVLPLVAPAGGPGFDPIARTVATETIAAVLGFARPETCLALTGDPALAILAKDQGIRTAVVPGGLGESLFDLPRDARRQLRDFAKTAGDEETAVLFVNPFNPLLTPRRLRLAVKAFLEAPNAPLVSVRACRNHPCQFQRHLRLADLDALHLLDPAWSPGPGIEARGADRLLASRPFSPHRFERHLFQALPGALASCLDGRPLSALEDGLACLFESDGLARLVFDPDPRVKGLPERLGERRDTFRPVGMLGHLRRTAALFEETGTGERHMFFTREFPVQPAFLLRLIPFSARDTFWDHTVDLPVTRLDRSCPLPGNPLPDAVGYIACVLETTQGGEYEMQELFTPPLAPWTFRDNRLYNLEKGCEIHGRQAFPEVVRPDGSLAVMPLALALEGHWSLENARAYPLPDEESLIVTDRTDYLRLLARRQANAS